MSDNWFIGYSSWTDVSFGILKKPDIKLSGNNGCIPGQ